MKLSLLSPAPSIWELDRVFTNYLLPQQKLLSKERHGAKVTKKHNAPATPHQRAIRHEAIRKRPAIQMNAAFKRDQTRRPLMPNTGPDWRVGNTGPGQENRPRETYKPGLERLTAPEVFK